MFTDCLTKQNNGMIDIWVHPPFIQLFMIFIYVYCFRQKTLTRLQGKTTGLHFPRHAVLTSIQKDREFGEVTLASQTSLVEEAIAFYSPIFPLAVISWFLRISAFK